MKDFSDTWLVVPCYNEGTVIQDVLENARKTFPNIVAVNDGSQDDSARRIHAAGALCAMNDPKARAHLEHQRSTEQDSDVLKAIEESLSKIKDRI